MKATERRQTCLLLAARFACSYLAMLATFAASAIGAEPTDKELKENNPPLRNPPINSPDLTEVKIWNVAKQPFRFRLARSTGLRWTDDIVVEPGKYQAIRIPKRGQPSELEGVSIRSDSSYNSRFIGIRYSKYGGFIEANLPLESSDVAIPNWYHVVDSNGFSAVIQSASIEDARTSQAELLRQPPLSPQEVERIKFTLKSNWLLYDK